MLIVITSSILLSMQIVDEIAYIFVIMFGVVFPCPVILIGFLLGFLRRKRIKNELKLFQKKIKYKSKFIEESEEDFICMICKLEICSGDIIYICPSCNTHYHENHFDDWFELETTCPVCDFDFLK
ncbi:MAG: E3 ubiquitin protein ligase [Asgard group archaeon]|nr:E3 ubiquitin protein ligase [Asgard group archaeon]